MISSGNAQPLKQYIVRIKDLLAPNAELNFGDVPFTGVNLPVEVFSNIELVKDTGFSCDISFDEGILNIYNFLKTVG